MELLQHCRDCTQQYFGKLLLEAEETLSNELFEQAEKNVSNEDQRRYFEALQQVKNHSNTMRNTFKDRVNQHYERFINGNDDEQSHFDTIINSTNLSLVDRDVLEDELAISVIVSKANSRNCESLWKLNRRLAVLRGGKNVSDETNPFGPALVCDALQAAITELELDNTSRVLTYKQLGKILVEQFSHILETLNALLINKGVLPNLNFSLANTETTQPTQKATTEQNTTTESATAIAHQQELYNAIRAMQSQNGPRTHTASGVSFSGIATGENNAADTFSPIDYVRALGTIQQSSAILSQATASQPIATDKIEEKLFEHLLTQDNEQNRNKISPDHADTVDLVGLIFRYMLDDPNLHDAAKSLLSHLHTPYLKLALMDESFLNNYEHSARILLNQMAEVSSRWVKEHNDRSVLPTIKKNVETILKEFHDDITIFDNLLEEFNHFRENLEKRAKIVEKRNTESQQGLERLELSKQRAKKEMTNRLQQAKISENVSHLLLKPWSEFLAFNLLRHGEKSLSWTSALKVVDGVVWSVKSEEALDSKEDFQRRQHNLEQSVNEGLETIGYDSQASKELLNSLTETHELAYLEAMATARNKIHPSIKESEKKPPSKKNVLPPNTKPDVTSTQTPQIKPVKPLEPALSNKEKNILATLKDIAFGTWFEFKQETSTITLKLAWFSRISSHYMFVDQSGVKQIVETQVNLAREMSAGNIKIVNLAGKSFMERALEAVIESLQLKK